MNNDTPIQKTKVFRVKTSLDKGITFEEQCKNEGTNINAKLNSLIEHSLLGQKKYFYAGNNKIQYNKATNNFSWLVLTDSRQRREILKNLSDDFLNNLKNQIEQAIQERNDWVHQTNSNSTHIPAELIKEEKNEENN